MPVVRLKQRAKWNGLMLTSLASVSIVRSSDKLFAMCSVIRETWFDDSVATRPALPGMLAHSDAMREAKASDSASAYELPVAHPEAISERMSSTSVATRASSRPMYMSNNASVRPNASIGFGSGPMSGDVDDERFAARALPCEAFELVSTAYEAERPQRQTAFGVARVDPIANVAASGRDQEYAVMRCRNVLQQAFRRNTHMLEAVTPPKRS